MALPGIFTSSASTIHSLTATPAELFRSHSGQEHSLEMAGRGRWACARLACAPVPTCRQDKTNPAKAAHIGCRPRNRWLKERLASTNPLHTSLVSAVSTMAKPAVHAAA
jgi:hypothetical protein